MTNCPRRFQLPPIPVALPIPLVILYLLSYPVALKIVGPWKPAGPLISKPKHSTAGAKKGLSTKAFFPVDGHYLPVYQPVDWLIDYTHIRDPLLLWADLWDVREPMTMAADRRRDVRW